MIHLSYSSLILVVLLFVALGAWHDSARAREKANRTAAELCRRQSLQLLDGTVALAALRPRFGKAGFRIERTYVFEYTARGTARASGFIVMLGRDLEHVGLDSGENV